MERRRTKMNVVNFDNNQAVDFGLEGSVVDFKVKEEPLLFFSDKKGIYKVDEEGEIIKYLEMDLGPYRILLFLE